MSSQKGNIARTRPQKHKNSRAFKNDLHDKTPKVKTMNGMNIENVCERCKCILEWKIKYKKYKFLTAAKKCTKCHEKKIKHAYHIMCLDCANLAHTCPKCGKEEMPTGDQVAEDNSSNKELQDLLKALPERKRRTLLRHLARGEGENMQGATKTSKLSELIAKFSAQVKLEEEDDGESSSEDFSDDVSFSNCSDSDDA